jgi:hypothetical protein
MKHEADTAAVARDIVAAITKAGENPRSVLRSISDPVKEPEAYVFTLTLENAKRFLVTVVAI